MFFTGYASAMVPLCARVVEVKRVQSNKRQSKEGGRFFMMSSSFLNEARYRRLDTLVMVKGYKFRPTVAVLNKYFASGKSWC